MLHTRIHLATRVFRSLSLALSVFSIAACSGSKPDISDVENYLVRSWDDWGGDYTSLTVEAIEKTKGVSMDVHGQGVYQILYAAKVRASDFAKLENYGYLWFRPGQAKEFRGTATFEMTDDGWVFSTNRFHKVTDLDIATPKEIRVSTEQLEDSIEGKWLKPKRRGSPDQTIVFFASGEYVDTVGRDFRGRDMSDKGSWRINDYTLVLEARTGIRSGIYYVVSYDEGSGRLLVRHNRGSENVVWTKQPPEKTRSTRAKFKTGDSVRVTDLLNIRSTAGGTIHGVQTARITGTVIGGPIATNGFVYWNIDYTTGPDGWSAESWLVKTTASIQKDE